jgi:hypothetical protein
MYAGIKMHVTIKPSDRRVSTTVSNLTQPGTGDDAGLKTNECFVHCSNNELTAEVCMDRACRFPLQMIYGLLLDLYEQVPVLPEVESIVIHVHIQICNYDLLF